MFTVDNKNRVKPMEATLLVPEFKEIWLADKRASKEQAMEEFAFIHFVCNHKSPFVERYAPENVEEEVKRQILKNPKYVVPERVKAGMDIYRRLYNPKIRQVFDVADLAVSRVIQELEKSLKSSSLTNDELKSALDLLNKIPQVAGNLAKARKELEENLETSKNKQIVFSRWEVPSEGDDDLTDMTGII